MIYLIAIHLQGGQGHERIDRLRWRDPQTSGTRENSTAELVSWIDGGGVAKVRNSNGRDVAVGVVRPAGRPPYLRTHADNTWNDNLLALPRF